MDRHQEHLLKLLDEIDQICRANDVVYTICGGTMLGAIRHGGFIPWDDDVDICMTSDNWEKFKLACSADLPEGRILVAPELQEDCNFQLPRYGDCTTTRIFKAGSLQRGFLGEVVDIFVLDPIADSPEAISSYMENVVLTHEIVNATSTAAHRYGIKASVVEEWQRKAAVEGQLETCRLLEERMKSAFDETGRNYIYRWHWGIFLLPRDIFEEVVRVPFESLELPIPRGVFKRLFWEYDETWPEFPGSVSVNQHKAPYLLDVPYERFQDAFVPSQDPAQLIEDMRWRKRTILENATVLGNSKEELAKARALVLGKETNEHLRVHADEFRDAYDSRDAVRLSALLGDYIERQAQGELLGYGGYETVHRYLHPLLADIPAEAFEAAAFALIGQDRLMLAKRFMDAREWLGMPQSALLAECRGYIDDFLEAVDAYERADFGKALRLSEQLRRVFPQSNMQLKLNCLVEKACGCDPLVLEQLVLEGCQRFPEDGFYLNMEAEFFEAQGDAATARAARIQAAEASRNGFVLEDVYRKTGTYPRWIRQSNWARSLALPYSEDVPEGKRGPSAPRTPRMSGEPVRMGGSARAVLYRLLCEVASCCQEEGIRYSLSGRAAIALKEQHVLPDTMSSYTLYCEDGRIDDLVSLLGGRMADSGNRLVESKTTTSEDESSQRTVAFYYATDSCYVRFGTTKRGRKPFLHIGIKPLSEYIERTKSLSDEAQTGVLEQFQDAWGMSFSALSGLARGKAKIRESLQLEPGDVVSASVSGQLLAEKGVPSKACLKRERKASQLRDELSERYIPFRQNMDEMAQAIEAWHGFPGEGSEASPLPEEADC